VEFGTIEREIYVEASPEVVFEVVSSPEHVRRWWPDEARYEPVAGSTGEILFGGRPGGATVQITVLEAQPPRTFSFRWTQPAGREKRYRVDEAQLARAVAQLTSVGAAWDSRLQRIKGIAEAIQRGQDH